MIQAVDTIAPQFPKTDFVLLDAQTTTFHPNVQTLFFKENESSFLAGVVAGMMTKTENVGFLGGVVADVINRYLVGFQQGVKYAPARGARTPSLLGATSDRNKSRMAAP